MEELVGLVVILLAAVFLIWFIPTLLAYSAKVAGASPANATWARGFLALVLCTIIEFLVVGAASLIVPVAGTIFGAILGVIIDSMVVASTFKIGFFGGFLAVIVNTILVAVTLVAVVALAGGIIALIGFGSGPVIIDTIDVPF